MKILVFGSNSPIGTCLVDCGRRRNHTIIRHTHEPCEGNHTWGNCLDWDMVFDTIHKWSPNYIVSLIGFNGNIELNQKRPADICDWTVQMNRNIMDMAARMDFVKKCLIPLSSCSYPWNKEILKESEYYDGPCHPTVEAHGYARKYLFTLGQQLNKQCGNKFVFPVLNNNFGIEDYWDRPNKLKVFGTLIKRFCDAKREKLPEVTIWGTGLARREGICFEDSGRLLLDVLEKYEDYGQPLNLGLGYDINIAQLCTLIAKYSGYEGKIVYDKTKPEGQMKKLLDVSKAKSLGFLPKIELQDGIKFTVQWYMENK